MEEQKQAVEETSSVERLTSEALREALEAMKRDVRGDAMDTFRHTAEDIRSVATVDLVKQTSDLQDTALARLGASSNDIHVQTGAFVALLKRTLRGGEETSSDRTDGEAPSSSGETEEKGTAADIDVGSIVALPPLAPTLASECDVLRTVLDNEMASAAKRLEELSAAMTSAREKADAFDEAVDGEIGAARAKLQAFATDVLKVQAPVPPPPPLPAVHVAKTPPHAAILEELHRPGLGDVDDASVLREVKSLLELFKIAYDGGNVETFRHPTDDEACDAGVPGIGAAEVHRGAISSPAVAKPGNSRVPDATKDNRGAPPEAAADSVPEECANPLLQAHLGSDI